MIKRLSHVAVYVLDQDRALKFYTEVLGFEVRTDTTVDGFRWLTVGPKNQPDLALLIAVPAPPMFAPEDAQTVQALVAKGAFHGGVLETDNVRAAGGCVIRWRGRDYPLAQPELIDDPAAPGAAFGASERAMMTRLGIGHCLRLRHRR